MKKKINRILAGIALAVDAYAFSWLFLGMASMNHPTLQDTLLLGGALGFGFLGILILFPLVFMASSPENKE